MDSVLEEKIVRANALLAERNRIDAELAEIFGVSIAEAQTDLVGRKPKKEKQTTAISGRGKTPGTERKCGNCGQSGHRKDKCPQRIGTGTIVIKDEVIPAPKREVYVPPTAKQMMDGALSKEEFSKANLRYAEGISGGDIADELGKPFEEVKLAIESSTFLVYIRERMKNKT